MELMRFSVKKYLIILFILSEIISKPVIAQNNPVIKKKNKVIEFTKRLSGQYDTINLEKAKKNVELVREQLRVAMQERKTQEKLSENAFEVFKKEINAQESKEVDELTSYTYGVRQSKIKEKDWVISDGRK